MAEPSTLLHETAFTGLDRDARQIVSIHAKRAYRLLPSGRCVPADKPLPFLLPSGEESEDSPIPETDIVPGKTHTDLIVVASAHAPKGRTTSMTASVALGPLRHDYRIFGPRRCIYRGRGSVVFSQPEPFDAIPLRYEHAYGGFDDTVPLPEVMKLYDALAPHPGIYPRNPAGMGYVVYESAERVDGLALPNIEHPQHLLTPQRLVAGSPDAWWKQPIPWSCDWFAKDWYPRCTFYGIFPEDLPDDDSQVAEVRLGWVEPGQNRRSREHKIAELFDHRLANAASPALILPYLRGDEQVELTGMTPEGKLVVTLPGARPRMKVRFEGRTHEVVPVPHRVLISTIEMGVYIVWGGAWHTPRVLPDRLPEPGDTNAMTMEGVEVFIDDRPIEPME